MKIYKLYYITIFVSISLVVLKADSPMSVFVAFNLMALLLLFTSIKAKFGLGREAAWWYGFSLFGWVNLLLGFAENPQRSLGARLIHKEFLTRMQHGELLQSIEYYMNFTGIKGYYIVDELVILFTIPIGLIGASFCSQISKFE